MISGFKSHMLVALTLLSAGTLRVSREEQEK